MKLMIKFKNEDIRCIKVDVVNIIEDVQELVYIPNVTNDRYTLLDTMQIIKLDEIKAVSLDDDVIYVDKEEEKKLKENLHDDFLDFISSINDEEEFDA